MDNDGVLQTKVDNELRKDLGLPLVVDPWRDRPSESVAQSVLRKYAHKAGISGERPRARGTRRRTDELYPLQWSKNMIAALKGLPFDPILGLNTTWRSHTALSPEIMRENMGLQHERAPIKILDSQATVNAWRMAQSLPEPGIEINGTFLQFKEEDGQLNEKLLAVVETARYQARHEPGLAYVVAIDDQFGSPDNPDRFDLMHKASELLAAELQVPVVLVSPDFTLGLTPEDIKDAHKRINDALATQDFGQSVLAKKKAEPKFGPEL